MGSVILMVTPEACEISAPSAQEAITALGLRAQARNCTAVGKSPISVEQLGCDSFEPQLPPLSNVVNDLVSPESLTRYFCSLSALRIVQIPIS